MYSIMSVEKKWIATYLTEKERSIGNAIGGVADYGGFDFCVLRNNNALDEEGNGTVGMAQWQDSCVWILHAVVRILPQLNFHLE